MKPAVRWAAIASCLTIAGLCFGHSGWILAKAQLAQVLLRQAWADTHSVEDRVKPWPWADAWPVARLRFPRLGSDYVILSDASGRTLAFAPGHLPGSAPPGEAGNVVVAGHRDTHFRDLRDLRIGDRIVLETPSRQSAVYRVVSAEVIDHRDGSVLEDTPEATLTLITCYPFDALRPGGHLRFVVRARRMRTAADLSDG